MKSHLDRNAFMLSGSLAKHGYDWWWHNFTAADSETGEEKAFFIEYFVINPALAKERPVLGQLPQHQHEGLKPSYVMIKAGVWGQNARQIHQFYSPLALKVQNDPLHIQVGDCELSETLLKGSCALSLEEAKQHPEYMSDAGQMSWSLRVNKKIPYVVGYGASKPFRALKAFDMFWHAAGISATYEGEVILDGRRYVVTPERSFGYADKNWGRDFTSPWLWMSSCHLISETTGKLLTNSAFDFGGGRPSVYGIAFSRKLLGCLVYEGKCYEFNFSKFWTRSNIVFGFNESDPLLNHWTLVATNPHAKVAIELYCKKDEMLFMNYEAPDGKKRHNRLWNGGNAFGKLKLYEVQGKQETLIDTITIKNAGCEYGEYDEA